MHNVSLRDDGYLSASLGSISLVHPSENLEACGTAYVLLAPRLVVRDQLTIDHVRFASLDNGWVIGSHDLRCCLSLCFDDSLNLSTAQHSSVTSQLASTLEQAELWQQLSLTAVLNGPEHTLKGSEIPRNCIELCLRPSLYPGSNDVSNLRSPELIPTIHLSLLRIDFCFTSRKSQQSANLSSIPNSSPKLSRKAVPVTLMKAFVAAVDAIFRTFVVPKPLSKAARLRMKESPNRKCLAQISPALFVPGYTAQVGSRSILIPFISKFLCAMGRRSRRLRRLHFDEAFSRHASANDDLCRDDVSPSICLSRTKIQAHLWLTLTNGLEDLQSSRRLRPLGTESDSTWDEPGYSRPESLQDPVEIFLEAYPERSDDVLRCRQFADDTTNDLTQEIRDEHDLDEILFDLYDAYRQGQSAGPDATQNQPNLWYNVGQDEASIGLVEKEPFLLSEVGCARANDEVVPLPPSQPGRGIVELNTDFFCDMSSDINSSNRPTSSLETQMVSNGSFDELAVTSIIGGPSALTDLVIRLLPHPKRLNHLTCAHSPSTASSHDLLEDGIILEALSEDFSILSVQDTDLNCENQTSSRASQEPPETLMLHEATMDQSRSQNRDSLSAILGDEHLMWHMWQRRTSVAPVPEDAIELHHMFAEDPDMKLLGSSRRMSRALVTVGIDEEMLDTDYSTNGTNSPTSPPAGPRKMYSDPFIPSPQKSVERPTSSRSARPAPPRRLSRGSSFLKRLSLSSRSSSGAGSASDIDMQRVEDFLNDKRRPVEIKRRKNLEDYRDMEKDGEIDEMMLS